MIKHLRVASDLHLEGFYGQDIRVLFDRFLPEDQRDPFSALVLAGDISSKPDQLVEFIRETLTVFPHVIYVPGNHEFYRQHIRQWSQQMKAELGALQRDNLSFVTGIDGVKTAILETEIGQVRFALTTLWGDGGPTTADKITTSHYLNDFRLIMHGDEPRRFTVFDMENTFNRLKRQLNEILLQPFDGESVVVTHHLPSRRLVSARFWPNDGSDGCNGGFVGDCDTILAYDHAPALWIHGHTHDTIDTKLWNTRVVANPAGYRGEWSTQFNSYWKLDQQSCPVAQPFFIDLSELVSG